MDEIAELRDALDRLHAALDDLVVRGVRAAGTPDLARLAALRDEFRDGGGRAPRRPAHHPRRRRPGRRPGRRGAPCCGR